MPLRALDIVLVEDPTSAPHALDPGGNQLEAILEAAAAIWEDIIDENQTITITWKWAALDADDLDDPVDGPLANALTTSVAVPLHGQITFNNKSAYQWFFDPTPMDHTEFDMTMTHFEDLSPDEQTNRFDESPPSRLEVAYGGPAFLTAPADARNNHDALSVALHEMAHALGLSSTLFQQAEVPDGAYDVPASYLGGTDTMEILTVTGNSFHIRGGESAAAEAYSPLMYTSIGTGFRKLPSATDVFALASATLGSPTDHEFRWEDIDLPRKIYMNTNAAWTDTNSWLGGVLPDGGDQVYIEDSMITLSAAGPVFVQRVEIIDADAQLDSRLEATGDILISGSGAGVETSSALQANTLRIRDQGELVLDGATVEVDAMLHLEISALFANPTTLEGEGAVHCGQGLTNDGIIEAKGSAILFSSDVALPWDLDGMVGNGELKALEGSLNFVGAHAGDFEGKLFVGEGRSAFFSDGLDLGSGGEIFLNPTQGAAPEDRAVILGGGSIGGSVQVSGESALRAGTVDILDGCDIQFNADVRLRIEDAAVIQAGAEFSGPGGLTVANDATALLLDGANLGVRMENRGDVILVTGVASHATANTQSFIQNSPGTLNMTIGSDSDPTRHDQLVVEQSAELDGTLHIDFDATSAVPGDRWTIMRYGSRTGEFDSVATPGVPAVMRLDLFYLADRIEAVLRRQMDYDTWVGGFTFPNAGSQAQSADPDKDKIPNLIEFYLGGDPTVADASILPRPRIHEENGERYPGLRVEIDPGTITLGADCVVERSLDLADWRNTGVILTGLQFLPNGRLARFYRSLTPLGQAGTDEQFMRLSITE